jgi:ribosomal protein S18 acetylase RimI-like enzyme
VAAVEIRPVRPEEHEEAGRVTARAYEAYLSGQEGWWEEYIGRIADVATRVERTIVLVAVEDHGRILGTVTLEHDLRIEPDRDPPAPGTAEIRMLGVDPTARRRGVGRALMVAGEDLARRLGRTVITLHTNDDMVAARRLYEDMGYRRGDDVVTQGGHVILTYVKHLEPASSEGGMS